MMFNKLTIKKINSKLTKTVLKKEKSKKKKKVNPILNQLKVLNPSNINVKTILKLQDKQNSKENLYEKSEKKEKTKLKKDQELNPKNILSNQNLILKTLKEQVNKIKSYNQYQYKKNDHQSLLREIKKRLKLNQKKSSEFFVPINYKLNHIEHHLEPDQTPYSNLKLSDSSSSNDEIKISPTTFKKQDMWINQLSHDEIITLGKLFVFFDANFSNLSKETIDEFFNLNFYSCYKKILHILKISS